MHIDLSCYRDRKKYFLIFQLFFEEILLLKEMLKKIKKKDIKFLLLVSKNAKNKRKN